MKVLKSFNDAHSAVYWLTQNRIDGASIEMTGSLKSMGAASVPSGNYHVVLNDGISISKDNEELLYDIVTKAVMDVLKDSSLSEEDEARVKYPMTSTGERSTVERPQERQDELRAALTAANAQAAKEAAEREARKKENPELFDERRGQAGGAGRGTSGVVGPLSG